MSNDRTREMEAFIKKFSKEISDRNAAIFAGAGLSVAAGCVDWKGLLRDVAVDLGLDVDKEYDLISVAQYHYNDALFNRSRLNHIIMEEFSSKSTVTENHRILSRLPITTYWTTNYDRLIETALKEAHKVADVKYDIPHLALTKHKRDAVVYKMHGDVENPDNAVLIKDDYEKYHLTHVPFINALSGDLVSKTFLFLGFSFTDPNMDYVLSRIRVHLKGNQRQHFCILKKISDNENDYQYLRIRQSHFITDLKRFNIRTLLVDDYTQITDILKRIEAIYRMKTIFISASAQEFGCMGEQRALDFVHELSKRLIKEDVTIVSGYGLGIGSAVINGTLEQLFEQSTHSLEERLILRPFPQKQTGNTSREELWDKYRRGMISLAGISIFLFGNKTTTDGKVVNADGLRKEFDIAIENRLKVIPVGATGYMAELLWKEVSKEFDRIYPGQTGDFKENFRIVGDKSSSDEQLLGAIIGMVRHLKKG